jgi:hypothetical protein
VFLLLPTAPDGRLLLPTAAYGRSYVPTLPIFTYPTTSMIFSANHTIREGLSDEVLLKTKYFRLTRGLTAKLAPRWVGPFKVIKAVGSFGLAYKIELPRIVQSMHPTFHVSALRPYKRSGSYQTPPLPEFIDGTPEWEVASIVDSRMRGKTREYLIRWQGWTDHDGWEP